MVTFYNAKNVKALNKNLTVTPNSELLVFMRYTFPNYWNAVLPRREGNALFNNTLNNFIYGYMALDIIMTKDHSDKRERGNLLPPLHWLLFSISSKRHFI